MSPNKKYRNVESKTSNINIVEKTTNRTVRKEKPKPNMPANIKVSIPLNRKKTETTAMPSHGRVKLKRKLDIETKIQLANEVARSQLAKSVPSLFPPNNVQKHKKKGRPKKVISDFFQNRVIIDNNRTGPKSKETVVTTTLQEKKPTKRPSAKKSPPPRRIVTRKRLANTTVQNIAKVPKLEPVLVPVSLMPMPIKCEELSSSPDLPDSDSEMGLYMLPQHTVVSPQHTVVSPQHTVVSPQHTVVSPQHTIVSPQNTKVPPQNTKVPPQKTIVPPQKTIVPPQVTIVSPQKTIVTPQKNIESSQKTLVTSRKTIVSPQKTIVPPRPTAKEAKPVIKMSRPTVKQPKTRKPPIAHQKRPTKGKQKKNVDGEKSPSILECLRISKGETESTTLVPQNPGPVISRKTSISSNSNLSWTKDISSSSTATSIIATSNDLVRFNKKLPIIKLTNIDHVLKKSKKKVPEPLETDAISDNSSDDSSDTDSTVSERKSQEPINDSIDVNSLRLSDSSRPSSCTSLTQSKNPNQDFTKAADKLALTMKKIDMEIISWMSSDNEEIDANLTKFKDKMFGILDNEFGIITHCRRLKEILEPAINKEVEETSVSKAVEVSRDDNNKDDNPVTSHVETNKDVDEFVKPRPFKRLPTANEESLNTNINVTRDDNSDDDMTAVSTYVADDHHDDDDALSLFAESISGFETFRMNHSTTPVSARPSEEYIPKPINNSAMRETEMQTYYPTKITIEDPKSSTSNVTICEKQNADSTSIFKQSNSMCDTESYEEFNENNDLDTRLPYNDFVKQPRLMESLFNGKPRSIVLNNFCFYNLTNCCRKIYYGQCRYAHVVPTADQVKAKLMLLDERMLMQEYLAQRHWTELRRRYGMCFVEESAKRGLSRMLVEIAYDFIIRARNDSEKDKYLRVNTIEVTLLHLNNVDLSVCEDLLKLPIQRDPSNRTLLCDVLMATMSITQNFSRFKSVFLNLTYFMVDNDRTLNKEVVEHILERVCILPFEEPVAKAVIQIMRLTNPEIFDDSMIGHFEKKISVNKDMLEEYTLLKEQCKFTSMLASSMMAGTLLMTEPPPSLKAAEDSKLPAASPDTTNLDKPKSTVDLTKPVIMRTIGMTPPTVFNRVLNKYTAPTTPGFQNSPGSSNSDDNSVVASWRTRAVFPHSRPNFFNPERKPPPLRPAVPIMQFRSHVRLPHRMPFHRMVTFKSPSSYIRPPGPPKQ